ncbi:MAG TPA: hypothetical protein VME70_00605 [Mycobacteriales bacterium]|nr:hypothetical protein [Mycobacteriales bacterium]
MAWRRKKPRDWSQRAFEESEMQRRERAAGGVPMPQPLSKSVDLPERSTWKWTLGGVAIIVVAILIRNGLDSRAPGLTTNCHVPAIALSSASVHRGSTLRWSGTGPAAMHFVITVGVGGLRPGAHPGQLSPVPDPGGSVNSTEIAVFPKALSSSCKANGSFTVDVPPGGYNVRMFKLIGSGSAVTGTPVATKRITVTS